MSTRDLIFINAVKEGNLSAIVTIVEAGGRQYLDTTTEVSRMTPLMYACEAGQLDVIKYFLSMGVSVNTADRAGLTPIMHAVLSGDSEVVEYLVKQDLSPIDLSKKSKEHKTALDLALMNDFSSIVRILRTPSPLPKEKKITGPSLVIPPAPSYVVTTFASTYGGSAFPPTFNLTPDTSPSSSPLPELSRQTRSSPPPGNSFWNGSPKTQVDSFRDRDRDRDRSGSIEGSTKSTSISLSKSSAVAETLLQITVSEKPKGETMEKKSGLSIFTAAGKGKLKILRQFNSELLGSKDKRGRTPLMYAARHGKFLPVAYLVSHGVSLNDVDDTGNTALMRAAERGNRCVFQYLLIEGADHTVKNIQGQAASDIAVRSRQLAIVDILSEWNQIEAKTLKKLETGKKESKSLRFAVAPDLIPYTLFPEEEIELALSIPPVPPPKDGPDSKKITRPLPSIPPFTGSSLSGTTRPAPGGFVGSPSLHASTQLPSAVLNPPPPPPPPPLPPSASLSRLLPSAVPLRSSTPPTSPQSSSPSGRGHMLPSSLLSVPSHAQQSGPWTPPPVYNHSPFLSHFVYEPTRKLSS